MKIKLDENLGEGRALMTLDVDFANPLVYPPADYPGIAVIRIPKRATATSLAFANVHAARGQRRRTRGTKAWDLRLGRESAPNVTNVSLDAYPWENAGENHGLPPRKPRPCGNGRQGKRSPPNAAGTPGKVPLTEAPPLLH